MAKAFSREYDNACVRGCAESISREMSPSHGWPLGFLLPRLLRKAATVFDSAGVTLRHGIAFSLSRS